MFIRNQIALENGNTLVEIVDQDGFIRTYETNSVVALMKEIRENR